MGCYAKVEGRPCKSAKYLFRCTKCKTVTCHPHMKHHAVECGSFVSVGEGNPNSDRIAELEAKIELLEAKLAGNTNEFPDEDTLRVYDRALSIGPQLSVQGAYEQSPQLSAEVAAILKDYSVDCFAKCRLIDSKMEEYPDTFLSPSVAEQVGSFFELHNSGDEANFKFFPNDDCRACQRKATYGG